MFHLLAALDAALALALNGWLAGATRLGPFLAWLAGADLLKSTPFILMLVACWHRPPLEASRLVVLQGMAGAVLAMGLGRLLPALLPHRARPLHDPALGLQDVPGVVRHGLDGWTSFPSDHGMLYGALVTLAFQLDRRLGWAMLGFASMVVWLPRLLLGFHYATDILAGALVGMLCALLAQRPEVRQYLGQPLLALSQRRPAFFYGAAFLALVQLSMTFTPLRNALGLLRLALLG